MRTSSTHPHSIRAFAAAVAAAGLIAAGTAGSTGKAAAATSAGRASPGTPQAGRLPLAFTRNDGQAPPAVRYIGQAQGVTALFTATGVTLDLTRAAADRGAAPGAIPAPGTRAQVTLAFRHANPRPRITGAGREPGTASYFAGDKPARWHTRVPAFTRVVYHQLWPGIDATFTAQGGTLRYSFTLTPGTSPSEVQLAYTGARSIAVGRSGALAISTPAGMLADQAPASTQTLRGRRTLVATRYRLTGGTGFGFTLARHAPGAAVTIDPGLDYATFLGGSQTEASESIGTDAAGDLYVFGYTSSTDFPTTPGAYQQQAPPGNTLPYSYGFFVTKLNPAGTTLLYSTFVAGASNDVQDHGVVDSSGNVYVAGSIAAGGAAGFPTTAGAFRRTPYPAASQSIVFKLSPSGSQLLYSTYLAPGLETAGLGSDIGLAPGGSVIVAGDTSSDLAPTTPGAFQASDPGGDPTGYVARLNATGTGLSYATYLGPTVTSQQSAVGTGGLAPQCFGEGANLAVDSQGDAYITGTCTAGFPTTTGAYQAVGTDAFDGLLVKLNPTGRRLDYATYYGAPPKVLSNGGAIIRPDAIAIDGSGDAYIAADVPAGDVPATTGAYAANCANPTPTTYCSAVAEVNPAGTGLVYSTYFGGDNDALPSVAVDASGNTYLTGVSFALDIPTTPGAYQPTPGNFSAPFYLAVLAHGGGSLRYATYFGGAGALSAGGAGGVSGYMTIAPQITGGTVAIGGYTSADNFPVTPGSYQTGYAGGFSDAWAAQLSLPGLTRRNRVQPGLAAPVLNEARQSGAGRPRPRAGRRGRVRLS